LFNIGAWKRKGKGCYTGYMKKKLLFKISSDQFTKRVLLFGFVKQVLIFVKNQCTLIDGKLKMDM